ncbi:relaxase MobL [Weissella minor]|uniref:relaxase MobL n=1 Tax=Weissella minor TaxID=1620 RepID=UPI003AF29BE1
MGDTLTASTSGSNPDIVIKHRFDTAKAYYVDYMLDHNGKDKELTDVRNDYDIVKANLAKEKGQFNDYLSYGARSDVTKLEDDVDQKLTTTFNGSSFNLTPTELLELQKHVDIAAKNQNLMWKTVVSFSDDFLIQEGIMDNAQDRHLDQKKIKQVIQSAMPEMLKAEGIDASAEWFANIHLHGDKNKNHIHVHIGTFEQETKRPEKFNVETKRLEPKGVFKQRTINKLKSNIWRNMRNDKTIENEKELLVEKDIAAKKLLSQIDDVGYKVEQRNLVNSLIAVLPDEKKKWRAKSNAIDMRAANALAAIFVDKMLEKDPDLIELFKKSTSSLEKNYDKSFGQNENKYAENQQQQLQERLINRLYQNLKNIDKQFLEPVSQSADLNQVLAENIEIKTILENQVKELKHKKQGVPKSLTRELGKRKRTIRNTNIKIKQADNEMKLSDLSSFIESNESDADQYVNDSLIVSTRNKLLEENYLLSLQLTPPFKLSDKEKQFKNELGKKYQDESAIKIDVVDETYLNEYIKRSEQEINLIQASSDEVFNAVYGYETGASREAVINRINKKRRIIEIKGQIHNNNALLNEKNDSSEKDIKRENAELFGKIAELEGRGNTYSDNNSANSKQDRAKNSFNDNLNRSHTVSGDYQNTRKVNERGRKKQKINLNGVENIMNDITHSVIKTEGADRQARFAYEREQQKLQQAYEREQELER